MAKDDFSLMLDAIPGAAPTAAPAAGATPAAASPAKAAPKPDEGFDLMLGSIPGAAPVPAGGGGAGVEQFVSQYGPLAKRVGDRLGVAPEALLGQWGLETGWGRSVIPGTNNLGNIKDFSKRADSVYAVDNQTKTNDAYRRFGSEDEFGDHFADLLTRRYGGALKSGDDTQRFFSTLKNGGYAEDKDYVAKGVRAAGMAAAAMGKNPQALATRGPAAPAARQPGDYHDPYQTGVEAQPRRTTGQIFKDAAQSGFESSKGLAAGFAGLLSATLGNSPDEGLTKELLDYSNGQSKKAAELQGDAASFTDAIGEGGDLGRWAANAAGYLGYQVGEAILTGGVGGLIGKAVGKKAVSTLASGMVEKEIGKLAATDAAKAMTQAQIAALAAGKVASQLSAASALFANNMRQEGGSIYTDALEEANKKGEQVDIGRVWAASLAAAGIDTAADVAMAKGVMGMREGSTAASYAGRAAREIPKGMAVQGGTEAAQTVIEQAGAKKEFDAKEVIDSAAIGALGGAAGGVATAVHKRTAELAPVAAAAAEPGNALSRAAMAGNTPEAIVAGAQQQAQAADQEAAANAPQTDPLADRTAAVLAAARAPGVTDALRAEGSPADVKKFVSDIAIAQSPSTPAAAREQALSRLEFALEWAGQSAAAPAAANVDAVAGTENLGSGVPGSNPTTPEQRRAGADRDAQLNQQAATAGTEFERQNAQAQAQVNRERRLGAPAAPAAAPTAPADTSTAAPAEVPSNAAPAPTPRAPQEESRQMAINGAMRSIEQRGGVASPAEAKLLADAGMGTPFDRIDETLAEGAPAARQPRERVRYGADEAAAEERDRRAAQDRANARGTADVGQRAPVEESRAVNAPERPAAQDVIAALTPDPTLRTAEQRITIDAARRGYSAEDMQLLQRAATGAPFNLTALDRARLDTLRAPPAQRSVERAEPTPTTGPAALDTPAVFRKRKETLRQLARTGFTKVERRADGFYLIGRPGQEFKLDGPADAQLARTALHDVIREGADKADTNASDKQKEVNNYRLGRVEFDGLKLGIENPIGSERSGTAPDGTKWSVKMVADYGDVTGTKGRDGDALDVYLVDKPRHGAPVFVIDQYNDDGKFDETKTVLGATSRAAAEKIYDAHFSDGSGPRRRGAVTQMTPEEFKAWAFSDKSTLPAGGLVQRTAAPAPAAADAEKPLRVRVGDETLVLDRVANLPEVESVDRGGKAVRVSKTKGRLLDALAGAFGKKIVFFDDPSNKVGDGFIMDNDPSTIYLNQSTGISPIAVFGHELTHQLKRDNPEAHAALEAVVAARLKDGALAKQANLYDADSALEEITSDLGGDLMSDPTFWRDVLDKVQADNGDKSRTIIAQLAEFIYRAINTLTRNLRSYGADQMVDDVAGVREAFKDAMAGYLQDQGISKQAMQADIMRAGQEAKRSVERAAAEKDMPQTETTAFKKWFGDSKVVNKDGTPMVVYHGSTERGVTEFDTTRETQRGKGDEAGTYFTTDAFNASGYTRPPMTLGKPFKGQRGDVTAAYLSLQNPLNTTADIKRGMKRGLSFGDAKREALKKLDRTVHDGIMFDGIGPAGPELVAFKPSQIKSATNNNGAFDANNADITRSVDRSDEPGFKAWSHGNQLVRMGEKHAFKSGEPVVVEAVHGTLNDFSEFKRDKANIESDWGGGIYASNSTDDTGRNYASTDGPDHVSKFQRHVERVMEAQDVDEEAAEVIANQELRDNSGASMPLYMRLDNPVVIGGRNETMLDYTEEQDADGEYTGEEGGKLTDFLMALQRIESDYYDFDYGRLVPDIMNYAVDGDVSVGTLKNIFDNSPGAQDATDSDGNHATSEILRRGLEEIGFDGIIDTTVSKKFKKMGLKAGDVHYIAFEPTQVKSRTGNSGAFSEDDADITRSVTRTPAFRKWFGDSKVVDESGEPLVVYHGTTYDFSEFKEGNGLAQSRAFFFAGPESTRYVEGYINQMMGGARRTMPVYLSLQNPKTVRASWDEDTFANPDFENEEIAKAKKQGHDGMIFIDPDAGERFFAAFKPEQIKSATGNNGSFDPNSADITRSAAREGDSLEALPAAKVDRLTSAAQRGERITGTRASISADEKMAIKFSAETTGFPEKEIARTVREHKLANPPAQGWAPLTFTRAVADQGKAIYSYKVVPYDFNAADGRALKPETPEYNKRVRAVGKSMADEVRNVLHRANDGDKNAQNILAQAGWYKAMRARLRHEFGGLGDLFADLLGATSPNTPVRDNWTNAVDSLRRASRGDFDQLIPAWESWASNVDEKETELRAWFNIQELLGKSKKEIKASPGYKSRTDALAKARELPDSLLPTKESGKKYGFNGRNVARAMVDLWRTVRDADPDIGRGATAPKALNFSGNLIGFRERATIDVWAARMLQRLAGGARIPSMAESGVAGAMRSDGSTTLQFGFGQDVFTDAAKRIRADSEMRTNPTLAKINDDDLQAVVWFIEKELWTVNNWTNAAGEGGSFELEASLTGPSEQGKIRALRKTVDSSLSTPVAKAAARAELAAMEKTVDRYVGGLSIQQSQGTQGRAYVPTDAAMARLGNEIRTAIYEGDDGATVLASKSLSTEGRYGDVERSMDLEVVARDNYNPTPLWRTMLEKAQEAKQDSTFLSRVLRDDESYDPLVHRPGVEIYFQEAAAGPKLEQALQSLAKEGVEFLTVIVDGRRMTAAREGAMPPAVGVRLQYVPEFEQRYGMDNLSGLSDEQLSTTIKAKADELEDIAFRVAAEVDGVSFAGRFWYETQVAFSHQYQEKIDGIATGLPEGERGTAGGQAEWRGQPVREGIESADRQAREADGTEPEPDGPGGRDAAGTVKRSVERLSTVLGTPARQGWEAETKLARAGRPVVVYRGARTPLAAENFRPESLGASTGNPSSGLGVWFTPDRGDASRYGEVQKFHLDVRNPKVVKVEDLPAFNSTTEATRWRDQQRAAGHDGVYVQAKHLGGIDQVVAFDPSQAIVPASASIVRSADRPVFYSQLEVALGAVPERLATQAAPQWALWLQANAGKLGVKKDEVEWSGILDYLKTRGKDRVTSDELQAYMRSNGVQLSETVLGGKDGSLDSLFDRLSAKLQGTEWRARDDGDGVVMFTNDDYPGYAYDFDDLPEELRDTLGPEMVAKRESGISKYETYVVPGGENYREVLITLPGREPRNLNEISQEMFGKRFSDLGDDEANKASTAEKNEKKAINYRSSHWDGAHPNIVAHLRVDDRTDADGARVMFVNEIQSDWGQDGKKKGFERDAMAVRVERQKALENLQNEIRKEAREKLGPDSLMLPYETLARQLNRSEDLTKARDGVRNAKFEPGVPMAPFVTDTKSWIALAMKRALVEAARDGYDKVAFINGQQAADLYDLSKRVESVLYEKDDEGTYEVEVRGLDGETIYEEEGIPASKIEDYVGKEIAQKIVNGEGEEVTPDGYRDWRRLSGLDLKVGGEGMKIFYDQIVPQVARDLAKKLGGNIVTSNIVGAHEQDIRISISSDGSATVEGQGEDREFDTVEEAEAYRDSLQSNKPQMAIEITPAMRSALDGGAAMFSKARPIADMNLMNGYKVGDILKSSKKVSWWDKTVGSMFNMAEKNPEFKKVYDGIQTFLGDVSRYATRAADLAPTVLPKLETMADIAKTPLSPADTAKLQGPVFEGTLNYTRDKAGKPIKTDDVGLAGIVWKDDELKSMWNLDDRQIGLYREVRKAINKSVADLAITDMLHYAGKDAEEVRAKALELNSVKAVAELLGDHLATKAAETPARADVLQNTAKVIAEKANAAQGLIAKGYAPLTRFGDHTVYVTRKAGDDVEQIYFGMYETQREANKAERSFRAEFKDDPSVDIKVGTMSKESYKLFSGVTPDTLSLFAGEIGIEESGDAQRDQIFQEMLKLTKANRSAMKRLIERKGVNGFSEDVGRVLAGFVYSNARQASGNLHTGTIAKYANEISDGDVKDHAVKLMQYVQNPQEEAQALRGLLFVNYIGGSVASALVNLTQSATTTWPVLSQHFGVGKATSGMAKALDVVRKGAGADKDLAAAMKRAEEEGITAPQETHSLQAQAAGRATLQGGDGTKLGNTLAKASNAISKVQLVWGKMFGWAEQINRKMAFAAAFSLARDKGIADPYEFAKKIVAETQYTMNKGNNQVWARGPVGATLFTFRKFMVNYLEGLARMWGSGPEGKKAFALSLGVLFLVAGAGGMPFADDLDDLIDFFAQRVLDKNWSTKQAKKEFFANLIGDAGADFVMSGASGLPGAPIDVSGRMGLGNIIPGSGLLVKKRDHSRDVAEIAGAGGDLITRWSNAIGQLAQGNVSGAAQQAAPTAATNLFKAVEMARLGYYTDFKGRKVIDTTMSEAVLKGIGFQPASVKKVQEATITQVQAIERNKLREAEIADIWTRGRVERDPALVQKAKDQLASWNKSNPDSPISIDASQINKRVQQAMMDKAKRVESTAPKEIRKSVKEELQRELAP